MKLIAIAAMTSDRIIAVDGKMPWKCKEDMKFFKEMTTGYPVIMGRTTLNDMGGPLPNRHNIVLSRTEKAPYIKYRLVNNVRDAISSAYTYCEIASKDKAFVIGGTSIYKQFAPHCDEVLLSIIGDDHVDSELMNMINVSGRGLDTNVNYFPYQDFVTHDVKITTQYF